MSEVRLPFFSDYIIFVNISIPLELSCGPVEEFLLRLRCSPLYINMVFDLSLWGGAMAFRKCRLNVSKRHRIVTKFGTSVDDGKAQLFLVQIFDICPQKCLALL